MEIKVDINVDFKEIILLEEIGCGTFSDVYSAKYPTKFGDKTIAVKKLRHSEVSSRQLERQLIFLSHLEHPNIVQLYGISKNQANRFHMLLEYSECGSLYDFLHKKESTIPDIYKPFWMLQCAKGIAYLHEKNIMHRNLKTANILLFDEFKTLKLCDIGTVREITSNNTANTGTENYMAPEVAIGEEYDTKCDVYSYGIIFWEVMSLKKPFHHLGDILPLVIQRLVMQGERPPINDIQGSKYLNEIKQLIKSCWHAESAKRPTMQEVLKKLETFDEVIEFEKKLSNVEVSETNVSWEAKNLILNKVHWQDILIDEQAIGIGTFGFIYKAKWKAIDGEKTIAVKRYRISDNGYRNFEKELKFLSRLSHDNILTLYGTSEDNDNGLMLLMEYAYFGSLKYVLHGNKGNINYSYFDALKWMHQFAKGMAYMHDRNIIHRDLRPSKLLFVDNFQTLKICSPISVTEVPALMTNLIGTVAYMAPEVAIREGYDTKCDVYSYGIIFWEVMSLKKPFHHLGDILPLFIQRLVMQGERPPINDIQGSKYLNEIKELIKSCWHAESAKRPTMQEVLKKLETFDEVIEFEKKLSNVEVSETNVSWEAKNLILNKVHWQDILIDEQAIGIGTFGVIYKAKWKAIDGVKTIAVKRYKMAKNEYRYLEEKLKFLSRLSHDNILTLYGTSEDNDNGLMLLMEYADCGSLEYVLHGNGGNINYSYFDALKWMHQFAKGMAYMHDRNIIHRDLKPSKLLFVDNLRTLKICRLTFSVSNVSILKTNAAVLPVYMAPEIIIDNTYTKKYDVYSFGIILWEVMSRRKPSTNCGSPEQILKDVLKGDRPNLSDANIFTNSDPIKELITKCWDSNPQKRPSMKELISFLIKILLSL